MNLSTVSKDIRLLGRIIFLYLVLGFFQNVRAQTYFFEKYSASKGLPESKIKAILQDKNYHIWVGTGNGLYRFSGLNFENIKSDKGIATKGVKAIYRDSHDNIWFGHYDGGISRYRRNKFESFPLLNYKKDITSFCENEKGELWITTYGAGVIRIFNPDAPVGKINHQQYRGKGLGDVVYGCIRTHDNKNYFNTDLVIKTYNPLTNSFDNLKLEGMSKLATVLFQIITMYEDKEFNLWFGSYNGGLYKYIRKEKKLIYYDKRDGLSSNWISCITQDSRGNIWVGTTDAGSGGGITRINKDGLKIFNRENGLPDKNITCITEDVEGNLLIGSYENGLSIFKGEGIVSFVKSNDITEYPQGIMPNPQVWSIMEDSEHKIWFGTNGGISIYNSKAPKNKQFKIFIGDDSGLLLKSPTSVRFIKEDQNRNVWVATETNGMFLYERKTDKFLPPTLVAINKALPPNSPRITALELDKKGNLWMGTVDGLVYYNVSAKKEPVRLSQENGLAGFDISAIYIDNNNTKYIGSKGKGLTVFTDSLQLNSRKDTLIGSTTPTCITVDISDNLWIGTEDQGLLCLRGRKIIKKYREKDGLLADNISFIIDDDKGNIYVGTNRGLNRINKSTNTIFTYTERNGFTGIDAKNNATYRDSENRLWFGTINGAFCYIPQLDNTPNIEPLTRIEKFIVNRKERQMEPGIRLNYKQNAIIFNYTSICLNNPDAVEYKIMLAGYNDTWEPVTKQTSKEYSALSPNRYIFKVIAKNSAGIWNNQPVTFAFRINPPFYQTWWFITICVLLGAVAMVMYIKIRERNLIKEKQVLEETVRERTAEVVKINIELAGKNKDVMDSIVYASRIQNALLPPSLPFSNTFTLLRPKDVVSGDFFWFLSDGDMEWIAAVDCTGHGVPGAFMSIIGNNSLNTIVKELGITKPAEILKKLDEKVAQTLHSYHQDTQIMDGMDIALMSYDCKRHLLEFAGAFNPLWLIRNGALIETPANRFAIGLAPDFQKNFTNHDVAIESGDTVYMFSDGYADQFGGTEGKKLKVGKFRELIVSLQNYPLDEQKQQLNEFLDNWKGNGPQIDDILVIGRRFEF